MRWTSLQRAHSPDTGFSDFWRQKPQGTSILFETIHRHKNGRLIPVEVNGIFFELKDRKLIFGVAHDITKRNNAEQALQEHTTLQRLLMTIAALTDQLRGTIKFDNDNETRVRLEFPVS